MKLTVGTPFGAMAEVGAVEVDVEIGGEDLKVLVGEVLVHLEDGQAKTVGAGESVTLEGMVLKLGSGGKQAPEPEGPAVITEPIVITLNANTKQVQIKRAGKDNWEAPKKQDQLSDGDALRTRGATDTEIKFGDSGSMRMSSGTELTMVKAGVAQQGQTASYALDNGTAKINLRRDGPTKAAPHEVMVAGKPVKITPGATAADIEITTNKKGRGKINVRLGKAILPDGSVIEAGNKATLKDGKIAGGVQPLTVSKLALRPNGSTIISYMGDVPPVQFELHGVKKEGPAALEVALDRDFKEMVFGEQLTGETFVYEGFKPTRYYWRVETTEGWARGTFKIKRYTAKDCPNCKRTNIIDDNGEKTKVVFQQALPAITLRWKPADGAVKYQAKVFEDGDFDAPKVDLTTDQTSVTLRSGRLNEGKYFWHVVALDGTGEEVSTSGKMNSLEIVYDNAILDLNIAAPRHGTRVTGGKLVTSGVSQLGSRLWINGKAVELEDQGRFKYTLNLNRGLNRIIYQVIAKDGIERFYTRDVIRK
jgi:hypothetical protein